MPHSSHSIYMCFHSPHSVLKRTECIAKYGSTNAFLSLGPKVLLSLPILRCTAKLWMQVSSQLWDLLRTICHFWHTRERPRPQWPLSIIINNNVKGKKNRGSKGRTIMSFFTLSPPIEQWKMCKEYWFDRLCKKNFLEIIKKQPILKMYVFLPFKMRCWPTGSKLLRDKTLDVYF